MTDTQSDKARLQPRPRSAVSRVLKVIVIAFILVVIAAAVVIRGIDARMKTAAAVKQETMELAVPTVSVIHAKPGSMKNDMVLPGNIQACMESPIYARASGYLKCWYADIGTHVKAGQVLAYIDAPEVDQQV